MRPEGPAYDSPTREGGVRYIINLSPLRATCGPDSWIQRRRRFPSPIALDRVFCNTLILWNQKPPREGSECFFALPHPHGWGYHKLALRASEPNRIHVTFSDVHRYVKLLIINASVFPHPSQNRPIRKKAIHALLSGQWLVEIG